MSFRAMLRGLDELSTCDVADALVKLGVRSGGYLPGLRQFSPTPPGPFQICGPAFTVLFVSSAEPKSSPPPAAHHIDAAPSGSVLVIQSPTGALNAVWGGLMTTGAKTKGIEGVVIDGNCRDLEEHREFSFPVIARGHSVLGTSPFLRPSAYQVPLTFSNPNPALHPPTIINPSDLILADIDGVVCVPSDMLDRVVELARKGKEVDERIKVDLERGGGVKESIKKHRG